MGLDATFGTTHGSGGLGNVHTLPITQQKRFALTWRQPLEFPLDDGDELTLLKGRLRVAHARYRGAGEKIGEFKGGSQGKILLDQAIMGAVRRWPVVRYLDQPSVSQ